MKNNTMYSEILEFSACGRDWRLHRPADLETLWESLEDDAFQEDERIPYWVELWPSSFALAAWLFANSKQLADNVCLDLGCGLGFTAMVGALAGAQVIGMDYEPESLEYASKNAVANGVQNPLWVTMDWRNPAVQKHSCAYVWGGDIMYEQRFITPVLSFLEHVLVPGGVMWLAEPGRNVYENFREALKPLGWSSCRIQQERVRALDGIEVTANIWEIKRLTGRG